MTNFKTFEDFMAASSANISITLFIVNLLLAAVLALSLSRIYVKYGTSLSNRRLFSRNFILITMTTMLIISIVKSSLALSLGLVGALSIVRFRAAIKEPEELAYLFLAIGIGLGFGANQGIITIVSFIVITAVLVLVRKSSYEVDENQNLHITVATNQPKKVNIEEIVKILKKYCSAVNLKRLDETASDLEASFLVEFDNFNKIDLTKKALQKIDDNLKFSFLDNKGIY